MTPGDQITFKTAEDTSAVTRELSALGKDTRALADESKNAKRKVPLASIPTIISIGLLVAALYLGGRILSARRSAPAAAIKPATLVVTPPSAVPSQEVPPVISQPAPWLPQKTEATPAEAAAIEPAPAKEAPAKLAPAPEKVTPTVQAEADAAGTITPQHGQLYIQVGALVTEAEATRRFVQRLRSEKLDPHIAPGPNPILVRVLIGPFENLESLNEKKAQLENEGVDTFVRKY